MPAESISPLLDASTEEKTGVHVAEDDKASGQNADQDTHPMMGEEVPPKTLAEDKAAGKDAD